MLDAEVKNTKQVNAGEDNNFVRKRRTTLDIGHGELLYWIGPIDSRQSGARNGTCNGSEPPVHRSVQIVS